jgi:DNA-binding CsgD family transcriptional regulator
VDAAERKEILFRYVSHSRRFDEVAVKRGQGNAEVIPFAAPLRELGQEPTARESEVLQLISEGLVNREIGHRLLLSEETVKSHVRHLLAKPQARSRAHAVARRLPPRPDCLAASRFLASPFLFSTCGYPSTEECPQPVENGS